MSSHALRVIGFAYKTEDEHDAEENLIFTGLLGLADPPKKDAKKDADTSTDAVVDGLIGLAALLIGGKVASDISKKNKLKERAAELEQEIKSLNKQIAEYESNWLKSAWYADEISTLKSKRAQYQAELTNIQHQLS